MWVRIPSTAVVATYESTFNSKLKQNGYETILRKFYFKRNIAFVNFFLEGKIIILILFIEFVKLFSCKTYSWEKCYRKSEYFLQKWGEYLYIG